MGAGAWDPTDRLEPREGSSSRATATRRPGVGRLWSQLATVVAAPTAAVATAPVERRRGPGEGWRTRAARTVRGVSWVLVTMGARGRFRSWTVSLSRSHRFCTKQSHRHPLHPPKALTMRPSRNSQAGPPGGDLPRRPARWPRAIHRRHGCVVSCCALLLQTHLPAPLPARTLLGIPCAHLDRHDPDLTRHTSRGLHSHSGSPLDTMSARARQHPSKPRRAR